MSDRHEMMEIALVSDEPSPVESDQSQHPIRPPVIVLAGRWLARRSLRQWLATLLAVVLVGGATLAAFIAAELRGAEFVASPEGLRGYGQPLAAGSLNEPIGYLWRIDLSVVGDTAVTDLSLHSIRDDGVAIFMAPADSATDGEQEVLLIGVDAATGREISLPGRGGLAELSSQTGVPTTRTRVPIGPNDSVIWLADGGYALLARQPAEGARRRYVSHLLDASGRDTAVLQGRLLNPIATDGTGGVTPAIGDATHEGRLFTLDGTSVVGWSPAGAYGNLELWRACAGTAAIEALARTMDRFVYIAPRTPFGMRGEMVGLDAHSGEVAWTASIAGSGGVRGGQNVGGAWTDGRVLLVRSPDVTPQMPHAVYWTARDVRTGQQLWQVLAVDDHIPIPEDAAEGNARIVADRLLRVGDCHAVNGHLLCVYGTEVTRIA